jgi:hypothetical protein
MEPKVSVSVLTGWFDRLVKHKMSGLAVCVSVSRLDPFS